MASAIVTKIQQWYAQWQLEQRAKANVAKGFSTELTDPEELARKRLGNVQASRKKTNVTGGLSGSPTLGTSFMWGM